MGVTAVGRQPQLLGRELSRLLQLGELPTDLRRMCRVLDRRRDRLASGKQFGMTAGNVTDITERLAAGRQRGEHSDPHQAIHPHAIPLHCRSTSGHASMMHDAHTQKRAG
jgi:hypothetical protein